MTAPLRDDAAKAYVASKSTDLCAGLDSALAPSCSTPSAGRASSIG